MSRSLNAILTPAAISAALSGVAVSPRARNVAVTPNEAHRSRASAICSAEMSMPVAMAPCCAKRDARNDSLERSYHLARLRVSLFAHGELHVQYNPIRRGRMIIKLLSRVMRYQIYFYATQFMFPKQFSQLPSLNVAVINTAEQHVFERKPFPPFQSFLKRFRGRHQLV